MEPRLAQTLFSIEELVNQLPIEERHKFRTRFNGAVHECIKNRYGELSTEPDAVGVLQDEEANLTGYETSEAVAIVAVMPQKRNAGLLEKRYGEESKRIKIRPGMKVRICTPAEAKQKKARIRTLYGQTPRDTLETEYMEEYIDDTCSVTTFMGP